MSRESKRAANKTFLADIAKKFGKDAKTPNDLSVPEYEAVYAYKAAVEKAGSTDGAAVLKALAASQRGRTARNDRHVQAAPRAPEHVSGGGPG